jgi:hypothetical protein
VSISINFRHKKARISGGWSAGQLIKSIALTQLERYTFGMNVQTMGVSPEAAQVALLEYKQHRNVYDKRDWEIERVYRQISKGKTVISVHDAIRRAGVDELGRPRLAIMRADQERVLCEPNLDEIRFTTATRSRAQDRSFVINWPGRPPVRNMWWSAQALLPRIPPQYRPVSISLAKYHILWEADWTAIPRDPYLLKRIGKDAWVVLAAWDLTDVELSVLRAHA